MRTATLIKRGILFFITYLFLLLIGWCYKNYATNEALRFVLEQLLLVSLFVILIILIIAITQFFIDLSNGDYDQWFATHTDPIIKKVQDFFNRRNKVL